MKPYSLKILGKQPLPHKGRQWFMCSLLLTVMTTLVYGFIIPAAPMADFHLPGFGEDGYKKWELRGKEAIYVNEDRIDIIDMQLRTFSDGYTLAVEFEISSPRATLFHQERLIQSGDDLLIEHPKYRIEGEDWMWESKAGRFVIKNNIRVVFGESLPDLLAMREGYPED